MRLRNIYEDLLMIFYCIYADVVSNPEIFLRANICDFKRFEIAFRRQKLMECINKFDFVMSFNLMIIIILWWSLYFSMNLNNLMLYVQHVKF